VGLGAVVDVGMSVGGIVGIAEAGILGEEIGTGVAAGLLDRSKQAGNNMQDKIITAGRQDLRSMGISFFRSGIQEVMNYRIQVL
jgi:hypothetical protein